MRKQRPQTAQDLKLGTMLSLTKSGEAQESFLRGNATWKPEYLVDRPQSAVVRNQLRRENRSFTSSTSTLMGDKEAHVVVLPAKRNFRVLRHLRLTILSVYLRLNMLVLIPNIITLIVLGVEHGLLRLPPEIIATATAANLTLAVLIRQEIIINLLFIIFGKCPQSFPLRIRRLAAKIYHLGGVHSGAGIAALIWFAIFNVSVVRARSNPVYLVIYRRTLAVTIILDICLVSIVFSSHPWFRSRYHNQWECIHRFGGWIAVGLFWYQFVTMICAQRSALQPKPHTWVLVTRSPVFYCLLVITISLILPWLQLKRVAVHCEPLSNHATRLHFTYTSLPLCAAPRLSERPLLEWHSFAGIPEENGVGFSVIVSKAGDWTQRIIKCPPTKLWVRGMPTRGVLHIAPIFKTMVLVATGSGIGPILSLLYARKLQCRILWSTPDPEATYQKSIIERVRLADPAAVIVNTSNAARPNLVQEAYQLYRSSNSEAIFIISNPSVTRRFVYRLEARGVPVFAPIFDS